MCYHFIGFQGYDRLPNPRALWRCSTCGRESRAPIDCCVRPAFAVISEPGMGYVMCQWLRAIGGRVVMGLAAIRQRYRLAESDLGITEIPAPSMEVEVPGPMQLETDIDSVEAEEAQTDQPSGVYSLLEIA